MSGDKWNADWLGTWTELHLWAHNTLNPFSFPSIGKHCLTHRELCRSPPCILLRNPTKPYLLQGWRILNFYRCDVEPRPFILAEHKRMEQFVFICKAALSQQQSPQFRCYWRITPNPQSISVGVFFYGGKMFTVRMPNSSKEVNWWVNLFPGIRLKFHLTLTLDTQFWHYGSSLKAGILTWVLFFKILINLYS